MLKIVMIKEPKITQTDTVEYFSFDEELAANPYLADLWLAELRDMEKRYALELEVKKYMDDLIKIFDLEDALAAELAAKEIPEDIITVFDLEFDSDLPF